MNCYLCFLEIGHATKGALGICHICGMGCCEDHIIAITSRPIMGMAGMTHQKRQIRCSLCHKDITSELRSNASTLARKEHLRQEPVAWWKRLTRQKQQTLPEPDEAVAIAERFLTHNRKHEGRDE